MGEEIDPSKTTKYLDFDNRILVGESPTTFIYFAHISSHFKIKN